MPLNLLHVGELCAFVPLLSCLGVKELPSPALVFLMHLGFSKPLMHKGFPFVLHELFSVLDPMVYHSRISLHFLRSRLCTNAAWVLL